MLLRQLFDPDTWTYTYLLAHGGEAVIIDSVRNQVQRDMTLIAELELTLKYALDTHVHADHVTGTGALRELTRCTTVASAKGPESAQVRLESGDKLVFGGTEIEGIATPGHTDDSMTYRVGSHLFTGDTLLVRGCGRSDFQNGDAGTLYDSVTERLFTLPDDTSVWPGHDYRGQTMSTIGEEKRFNRRLAGQSRDEFIDTMDKLNLAPPKFLHEAVPANRELGMGIAGSGGPGGIDECTSADLKGSGPWAQILDVREPHEFDGELGHIPGARNIPMDLFPEVARGWPRDDTLLVVCRSGRRSREVCEKLAGLGFQKVSNLRGGMLDYRERGQGVE